MNQLIDQELAVSVREVTKNFRREGGMRRMRRRQMRTPDKRALDGVSLAIARGEMVAIVGLNGSGKSTLIRVLATLTLPDSGSASVFGYDVVRESHEVRRHVNRVSVDAAFFKEMSPWENLSYATRLYGDNGSDMRGRALRALSRLGLPRTVVDRPMKHLSRGQQQKVAIARSLLTSPALLLMDEPTTGLDPRSKREVQDFVVSLHRETGATVVVCTHDLAEAEAMCSRVIVLDRGRVLADDSPAALRATHDNVSLEDVFLKVTGRTFIEESEDGVDEDDDASVQELVSTGNTS